MFEIRLVLLKVSASSLLFDSLLQVLMDFHCEISPFLVVTTVVVAGPAVGVVPDAAISQSPFPGCGAVIVLT